MQVEIKARHFTLKDEQREAVEASLDKLEKFIPRPLKALKVTIDHDAGHFEADGVLQLKNQEFRAKGAGEEPEYAVNELAESLKKQLLTFKGKISGAPAGEEGGLGRAMLDDAGLLPAEDSDAEGFVLRDMDVAAAKARFAEEDGPFLVFRNADNARVAVIYRRDDGELGHMESNND